MKNRFIYLLLIESVEAFRWLGQKPAEGTCQKGLLLSEYNLRQQWAGLQILLVY